MFFIFVANFVDPSRSFISNKVYNKVRLSFGWRIPSSLRSTVAAGRDRGGLVYGEPPGSLRLAKHSTFASLARSRPAPYSFDLLITRQALRACRSTNRISGFIAPPYL